MTYDEAVAFIWKEGVEAEGISLSARMGEDPGPERMKAVIAAIKVVYENLKGQKTIDRQLALALHCLSYYTDLQLTGWTSKGIRFRDDLIDSEMPRLTCAVESVFCDEWISAFAEDG
jgi:hypothetical protein